MNADSLLELYERVAEAPDATARLRRFVLDLAVRGKLVAQDPADEPASMLLKRIAAQLKKHESGRGRRAKPLPELDPADAPFKLPDGWTWARFPEIGKFGRGKSKHRPRNDPALYSGGIHRMIQTGDVARSGGRITTYTKKYNDIGLAQSMLWPKGTLCITIAANIADSGILEFDACFPDSVVGFIPAPVFENPRYFEYFVRTSKSNLLEFAPATAQKNINLEILTSVLIPLPPLAEQRRIVAKVDELMALLDRLDAARTAREATRDRLTAASLARLTAPESDPADFPGNTRFVLDALPALTARADQVKQLRQTILNLAVRGKLVEQDPADEPASELLERIGAERTEIARNAGFKLKKPIPRDVKFNEVRLPNGWVWSQLDELAWKITDGDHQTPKREAQGRYLLSARNVLDGQIDISNVDFVGEAEFERMRLRCDPDRFDILISCSGSVGRVAIVDKDNAYVLVRSAALVKLTSGQELSGYIQKVLLSDILKDQIGVRSKAAAQPNLFLGQIRQLMLPLPPLAEQHRIVAKIDTLMALCDQLEAALVTADTTRARLLETLLHDALTPATSPEMEAAE